MSIQEPTEYDEYIGQETVNCEYKEFTFNLTGLALNIKLAEYYCTNNLFDFNKNVLFNLHKYFRVYLGKYACGYFNSGIDGKCYIGINDYGFVKGIPFKGHIPISNLKNKIRQILNTSVKNTEIPVLDWKNLVQIEIVKIKSDFNLESKQNPKFVSYLKEKENYDVKYKEFVNKTNQWRLKMNFTLNKLVDLTNNPVTRVQMIEYIKKHDSNNPVIKLFESDFELKYKPHDEIIQIKDDPTEPYYWVTRWKDWMVSTIKSEKPAIGSTFNMFHTPINLLVGASEMIPYWLTYNSNMNLYVIQIKFSGSKLSIDDSKSDELFSSNYGNFEYLDAGSKKWVRCYRTILSTGDPVCLPL
jgi:hypothetical protein